MDQFEIETLCRRGDTSPDAIHARLVAARESTGLSAKEIAKAAGIVYTTFKSQEKAGAPAVRHVAYYLSRHQIDFNFIFGGDPSRLPGETLAAIAERLSANANK